MSFKTFARRMRTNGHYREIEHHGSCGALSSDRSRDVAWCHAAIVEKDFWVCWALRRIFEVFFAQSWAHYETARPGTLRLLPAADRLDALRRDYQAMESMLFGDAPEWGDIVRELVRLETRINNLGGVLKGPA
jgi:hypothetical protein